MVVKFHIEWKLRVLKTIRKTDQKNVITSLHVYDKYESLNVCLYFNHTWTDFNKMIFRDRPYPVIARNLLFIWKKEAFSNLYFDVEQKYIGPKSFLQPVQVEK